MAEVDRAVWFPEWRAVLDAEAWDGASRAAFRAMIVRYLGYCRQTGLHATIDSARRLPEGVLPEEVELVKGALNWFFRRAAERRRQAAPDMGATEWGAGRGVSA